MPQRKDTKCPGFTRNGQDYVCAGNGNKHWQSLRCVTCHGESKIKLLAPPLQLEADREKKRIANEIASLKQRYEESLKTIERQEKAIKALGVLGEGLETFHIEPQKGTGRCEATVVVKASDWQAEGRVVAGPVAGLND